MVQVEPGKKEGDLVEIISGINNKDKIIKTEIKELSDGDSVKINNEK